MGRASVVLIVTWASVLQAGAAFAQDPAPAAGPVPTESFVVASAESSADHEWLQKGVERAELRVKRSRNALIGTTGVFALGAILTGVGASQCGIATRVGEDELVCNNAGNVLVPLGGTLIVLGAVGMISAGIVLGVANKRRREADRRLRRYEVGRRLQWDVSRGAVTF